MAMVEAILLKPLDGREIGSRAEFSKSDFERLKAQNAVKAAPKKIAGEAPEESPAKAPEKKAARRPANKSAKPPANKQA